MKKIDPFKSITRILSMFFLLFLIIWIPGVASSQDQDTVSNGNAFNFPFRKSGISIGNSYEFNGLRMNYADSNLVRVNGINITLWVKKFENQSARVNGISLGGFPLGGTMQPINIGIVGVAARQLNGFSLGGLGIGSPESINGLSISGIFTLADSPEGRITGMALSGIGIGTDGAIHGLAVAPIVAGNTINGIAASPGYIRSQNIVRGLVITPGYLDINHFKGVTIAGYSRSSKMNGLSIAVLNKTSELKGIQLGLLNFAANNRKGLKITPLVNFHF
jgi:hypothetical protein